MTRKDIDIYVGITADTKEADKVVKASDKIINNIKKLNKEGTKRPKDVQMPKIKGSFSTINQLKKQANQQAVASTPTISKLKNKAKEVLKNNKGAINGPGFKTYKPSEAAKEQNKALTEAAKKAEKEKIKQDKLIEKEAKRKKDLKKKAAEKLLTNKEVMGTKFATPKNAPQIDYGGPMGTWKKFKYQKMFGKEVANSNIAMTKFQGTTEALGVGEARLFQRMKKSGLQLNKEGKFYRTIVNKQGQRQKLHVKDQNAMKRLTKESKKFNMNLLSMMFFGMSISRIFRSWTTTLTDMAGISDAFAASQQIIMSSMLEPAVWVTEQILNLTEALDKMTIAGISGSQAVAGFMLAGDAFGTMLSSVGQVGLGIQGLQNEFEDLFVIFEPVKGAIISGLDKIGLGGLGKILGNVGPGTMAATLGIAVNSQLQKALNNFSTKFANGTLIPDMSNAFDINGAVDKSNTFASDILSLAQDINRTFTFMLPDNMKYLGTDMAKTLLQTLGVGLDAVTGGLGSTVLAGIMTGTEWKTGGKVIGESILDTLSNPIEASAGAVTSVLTPLIDFAEGIPILNEVLSTGVNLGQLAESFVSNPENDPTIGALRSLIGVVGFFGGLLVGVASQIAKPIAEILIEASGINKVIEDLKTGQIALKNIWDNLTPTFNGMWSDIVSMSGNIVSGMSDILLNTFSYLSTLAEDIGVKITTYLSPVLDPLKNTLDGVWSSLVELAGRIGIKLPGTDTNAGGSTGTTATSTSVVEWGWNALTNAWEQVGSFVSNMTNLGQGVVADNILPFSPMINQGEPNVWTEGTIQFPINFLLDDNDIFGDTAALGQSIAMRTGAAMADNPVELPFFYVAQNAWEQAAIDAYNESGARYGSGEEESYGRGEDQGAWMSEWFRVHLEQEQAWAEVADKTHMAQEDIDELTSKVTGWTAEDLPRVQEGQYYNAITGTIRNEGNNPAYDYTNEGEIRRQQAERAASDLTNIATSILGEEYVVQLRNLNSKVHSNWTNQVYGWEALEDWYNNAIKEGISLNKISEVMNQIIDKSEEWRDTESWKHQAEQILGYLSPTVSTNQGTVNKGAMDVIPRVISNPVSQPSGVIEQPKKPITSVLSSVQQEIKDKYGWATGHIATLSDVIKGTEDWANNKLSLAAVTSLTNSWGSDIPVYKKGGYVPNTGLAYLHAGETVIPAGQGGTQIIYIQPDITLNVSQISSNIDVKRIGAQLSEEWGSELRRRSAYLGR